MYNMLYGIGAEYYYWWGRGIANTRMKRWRRCDEYTRRYKNILLCCCGIYAVFYYVCGCMNCVMEFIYEIRFLTHNVYCVWFTNILCGNYMNRINTFPNFIFGFFVLFFLLLDLVNQIFFLLLWHYEKIDQKS